MKLLVVAYAVILIGVYIGLAVHDEMSKSESRTNFNTIQRVGLAILWPILLTAAGTVALARICDIGDYVMELKDQKK